VWYHFASQPFRLAGGTMATFVLIHPAWFGGWCWKKVTPLLRAQGHRVYTPTLTGLGERTHLVHRAVVLDTHVEDVVEVLKYEDLSQVILVGNSSGGMVITGVADRAPERVAQVVYLDAFVPEDGESLFDNLPPERQRAMETLVASEGEGWLLPRFALPPWERILRELWCVTDEADQRWALARLVATPFAHFKQPLQRRDPHAASLPRRFIRCQQWASAIFDRYAENARRSEGWTTHELAATHLPFITHPHELTALLLEIAA
jgi:pimeloyl-ACP methyl ester carboxylesterase